MWFHEWNHMRNHMQSYATFPTGSRKDWWVAFSPHSLPFAFFIFCFFILKYNKLQHMKYKIAYASVNLWFYIFYLLRNNTTDMRGRGIEMFFLFQDWGKSWFETNDMIPREWSSRHFLFGRFIFSPSLLGDANFSPIDRRWLTAICTI